MNEISNVIFFFFFPFNNEKSNSHQIKTIGNTNVCAIVESVITCSYHCYSSCSLQEGKY